MSILLILLSLCARVFSREVVSFDFGWKHRTGLHAWAKPDDQPELNPVPDAHAAESQIDYVDDDWISVQLPHDGLIATAPSKKACPHGCSGNSFIPRHVLWYRKKFVLPESWIGSSVWLDFEGSFRLTTVWINGDLVASHDCGYTPFRVHLDNITSIQFGKKNLISVFVDPDNGDEGARDRGSGWWYEGGGIYRDVQLVRANKLHIEQDGLFIYSNLTASAHGKTSAVVTASASIINKGATSAVMCMSFELTAPNGSVVASSVDGTGNFLFRVSPGESVVAMGSLTISSPKLWNAATPYLYSVRALVRENRCSSPPVDTLQASHGIRSLRYDANEGFFLNDEHFKIRGFCDHNTFAVVGMAVPPRINLFRAQASRAIGGNGRRTSHNPPATTMLDIYDRIGIVVMDENRLFANETKYVNNMGVMVKRDRNHPSVIIWSFCNENGCEGDREAGGPRFREISYKYDGTRPVLGNMFTFGDLLSNTIDVQGFSHETRSQIDSCHAKLPNKPIFMSECCSCNTMRDEDEGCETISDNPHNVCIQKSFNARCAESNSATNASDGVAYAVGTMVWTLFDYYGEPPSGDIEVSGTYGQFDLGGFPKAAAFWYRTQWLLTIPDGPDKTFPTNGAHEVHLVESWQSPDSFPSTKGNNTRSIHAYTSAPFVELFVNGKSQGTRDVRPMNQGAGSYAEWTHVPWEHGAIKAVARDSNGLAVADASRHTSGQPVALSFTIDAPNENTGTGTALFLDGQDAALLRASVIDAAGHVCTLASNNVSFRVIRGPGLVQGSHNGDPHCYEPNNAPWHSAYHGLVRAVVRVTSVAGRSSLERGLLQQIDVDGPMALGRQVMEVNNIIVEASSPGLTSARVVIPVSTNPAIDVLAVAAEAAGRPVDFFGHSRLNDATMTVV